MSRYYRGKIPKRGRELTGDDPIIKSLAGGVEGKPHSSKEGRMASALRKFGRISDDARYDPNPFKPKIKRAKHGLGSIVKGVKKIISTVTKPKGVFKPKPVPKAVTDKPTGWSPKGSYTEADDKKITSILKKLGDEIKAAPLPPKLKATLKKAQKAFPHKK